MSEGEDCRKGSLQMLYLEPSLGMYRSSESEKVRSVGSGTLDRIPISLIGRYYSQGGEASQAKALGQLQEIVDREKKFFTRNTGFATNTGFEEASLETAVSHHSNSKMNQHEHEAHVAQQFRHDKMRISEAYSFPPLTCFPNQRCAFSSVALQQPTQLEMQLANSELSGTLGHLKGYSGSSVDETTLGNVLPTYSSEAAASGDYAFSSGIDLLDIPSRGENLLKASVSDMLQRPSEVALAYTSQTAHRDGLEGHSEAVESKWTNWIFPERNLQYHPISTLGNFGGLQTVQGSAVPEAGQRATNSLISSLLAGPNMQEGLLNATARNASFGSVHTKNASDETVQPYLMSGHSDLSNLRVNTNHFASGNRNQQQYDLVSSLPSLFTQKPSTMQPLSSDISTSAQERFYSSQNLLNTGDYNQRSKWGNGGSELVLLPGSTNVGLNQSRSSDPLGSMKSIRGTGPLYGSVQAPLPFAQWERQGQTSENSGRSLSTENFTIGNLRQGQGQGLSLSLSSQQQSTPEFHGFDTRIPHAGSFSILRNSKFAKAAQQLLHEFCNVGRCEKKAVSAQRATISQTWMDGEKTSAYQQKNDSSNTTTIVATDGTKSIKPDATSSDPPSGPAIVQMQPEERNQLQMKKSKLVAMVEEVERRYRQYHDQIQMVITSFESAMGLRAAAPYTALARQVMSRNFRCLRDAITGQIHAICEALGEELSNVPVLSKGETPRLRILDRQLRHQRSLQQIGMLQQQVWRPQRGLPEQSVSVLRAWLFEHFLHPYPKDTEKLMLARQTSLTRSQVSNWFINARVRLWKPMVEEMYVEESKEAEFQAANEVGSSQMNEEGKSKILESDCGLQAAVRNADIKQGRKVANDGNSTSNSIQGTSEQDHSSESEYASGSSRAQQASGVFNSVSAEPSLLQRAPGSTLKSIDAGMDIQESAPFFPPKDVEMRYEGAGSEQGVRMHERQQNMERGSIVRDSPDSRAEGSVCFELKDGGRPTKGHPEGLAAQTQLRGGSSGVTLTLGLQQHFSSQNKKSVGWAK